MERRLQKILIPFLMCLVPGVAVVAQDYVTTTTLNEVTIVGAKQTPERNIGASSTLDSAMLRMANVTRMVDVGTIAPNVYMPAYGSRMTSAMYVRGMGSRMDQAVMGLNVDGVPYLNKDAYDFDIFDIDKIEVYRGAQSVLNGRNTIGGQINITTISPWQYNGVRTCLEYGRHNLLRVGAGWCGRLHKRWAMSVSGEFMRKDGEFVNSYNNSRIGAERNAGLRWKTSWHPREARLTLSNTASVSYASSNGYPYRNIDNPSIAYNDTCYYRRTTIADALTIGWSGKRVVVNSVTSFQAIDDNMTLDQDFSTDDYFTLTQRRREWALTEDMFAHHHRGRYHWITGLFAFYRHNNMSAPVTFKEDGIDRLILWHPNQLNPDYPLRWDDPTFVLGSDFKQYSRSLALYHQSDITLGQWRIECGLRWEIESATLDYKNRCNTSYTIMQHDASGELKPYRTMPVDIDYDGHLSLTFNRFLPKVAVSLATGPVNSYVSVTRGYKAGGFNTQMFSDVLQQRIMNMMGMGTPYDIDKVVTYQPEQSWNYEIASQYTSRNGRLTTSITAFFIRCSDQQLTMFPAGNTTGRITTNAGRTRNMGVEASVKYRPVDVLTLRSDYGYTNATFRKYFNGIADYRGNVVPYAPQHTLFVSACYRPRLTNTWIIPNTTPWVEVNVRGIGSIYWDEANTVSQPFYALLGASCGLDSDKWSLQLWGKNLTNTHYDTFYFVSVSRKFVNAGPGWSIGMTLRLNLYR